MNAALMRSLHDGTFLAAQRNVVLVGGTGSAVAALLLALHPVYWKVQVSVSTLSWSFSGRDEARAFVSPGWSWIPGSAATPGLLASGWSGT